MKTMKSAFARVDPARAMVECMTTLPHINPALENGHYWWDVSILIDEKTGSTLVVGSPITFVYFGWPFMDEYERYATQDDLKNFYVTKTRKRWFGLFGEAAPFLKGWTRVRSTKRAQVTFIRNCSIVET